jgi:hypothetical protein
MLYYVVFMYCSGCFSDVQIIIRIIVVDIICRVGLVQYCTGCRHGGCSVS